MHTDQAEDDPERIPHALQGVGGNLPNSGSNFVSMNSQSVMFYLLKARI